MVRRCGIVLLVLAGLGCAPARTTDCDIHVVSAAQLDRMLASQPPLKVGRTTLLVDVRSPRYFQEGHIPGAVNIPVTGLEEHRRQLDAAKNIVMYAAGSTDRLSGSACKKLLSMGYRNVYEFRGGLAVWNQKHPSAASGGEPGP